MADVHEPEVRSYNMSKIRNKDTKPEIIVRKYLHSLGFRYRLHDKSLPGKPDIVLKKYNIVIFIHGCFWHGHENCRYFSLPSSNEEYWIPKIENNKAKDIKQLRECSDLGWRTIVVWECQLKKDKRHNTLSALANQIRTLR